ncbi:MAG: glycosyltransferase family 4 protein [Candidatus Caldarchaeum sp.]
MRILLLSDGPQITTGYGIIARNFGKYLRRKGFEVFFGSLQNLGEPLYIQVDGSYVPVYSCYGGQQPYMEKALRETTPDIVIHVRDPVVLQAGYFSSPYRLKPVCSKYGAKTVHWAPIMGEPHPDIVKALQEDSDLVLMPTEWSYNICLFSGLPANRMAMLRWGVDTEVYKPLPPELMPSREEMGFTEGRFMIMSASVHDRIHKAHPILMKAVSILLKKYDVELYLHTGSGAFHLQHYAEILGLKGRVIIPSIYLKDWGVPAETMNKIYNVADVVVSASTLEGANMVICEGLACGKPIVASKLPVHVEMTQDRGLYSDIVAYMPETFHFTMVTTAEMIAAKIEQVIEGWRPSGVEDYRKWISWENRVNEFEEVLKKCGWA